MLSSKTFLGLVGNNATIHYIKQLYRNLDISKNKMKKNEILKTIFDISNILKQSH